MHHYLMLPHSAVEPGKQLSLVAGLINNICLKMHKKEVHFILEMILSKIWTNLHGVSLHGATRGCTGTDGDPRMTLTVSGINGQELSLILGVIIISCCHL